MTFATIKKLTQELRAAGKCQGSEDEQAYSRKVEQAMAALNAAWTNPAIEQEAAILKNRLDEAWYDYTH